MLTKIQYFLNSILEQEAETLAYDDTIAIVCLICEVSNADQ